MKFDNKSKKSTSKSMSTVHTEDFLNINVEKSFVYYWLFGPYKYKTRGINKGAKSQRLEHLVCKDT